MAHTAQTAPRPTLPRVFVASVGAVILATLVTVAVAVWWLPAAQPIAEVPRASLTVRFIEQSDGALSVVDVGSGHEMDRVAPGENGFLRTLLRVVRRDIDRTPAVISMPFRIEAWQDHRVTLTDSATGRRIDLIAFGPTNAEVFIRWLGGRTHGG